VLKIFGVCSQVIRISNVLEAVRISFPFYDRMQVLLGESHSHNPLYVRQSTSTISKNLNSVTAVHKITRPIQIKPVRASSMSINDDNSPVSTNRSRNSMVAQSPFFNFEMDQAEQEMIDEIGDNDNDIHQFYDENAAFIDHTAGDEYESDTEISILSTPKSQSQQPRCLTSIKRPSSSDSTVSSIQDSPSSTNLSQRKRQKVNKSEDNKDALERIYKMQSERNHELAMAKVKLDNKRLEYDEKKLEMEKEQLARKLAIEERRMELDSRRMEQQNEILKLQIEMMKQLLGRIRHQ
jgi:hypothetical protein